MAVVTQTEEILRGSSQTDLEKSIPNKEIDLISLQSDEEEAGVPLMTNIEASNKEKFKKYPVLPTTNESKSKITLTLQK